MKKGEPPTLKAVRKWIRKRYGNVYSRGAEIPLFTPEDKPEWIHPGRTIVIENRYKFVLMQMPRVDYVFELHGVMYLVETDYRIEMYSMGQLAAYRQWFPRAYPKWMYARGHKGEDEFKKKIKCLLFVYKLEGEMHNVAKKLHIKVIKLKKPKNL